MLVRDVYSLLNSFAPYETQAHYDNSGLNVGNPDVEVTKILLAVDVSLETIEEAKQNGCNVILSHHPIIFSPMKSILESNYVGKIVIEAIKASIALISCHTNMDLADGGINDSLASYLEGDNIRKIEVDEFARVFDVPEVDLFDYALFVSNKLSDDRVSTIGSGKVHTVAVVGGAGGDYGLIDYCINNDIVLVTSEIKHHSARMIEDRGGKLITVGHFTSEKVFINIVKSILKDKVEILESSQTTPFNSGR